MCMCGAVHHASLYSFCVARLHGIKSLEQGERMSSSAQSSSNKQSQLHASLSRSLLPPSLIWVCVSVWHASVSAFCLSLIPVIRREHTHQRRERSSRSRARFHFLSCSLVFSFARSSSLTLFFSLPSPQMIVSVYLACERGSTQ